MSIVFILFVVSVLAKAEYSDHRNRKVDSLEHVLRTKPPKGKTELIRIYDALACGYLEVNGKASMKYAEKGIALAKEIEAYKTLSNFYRIEGMHHWGNSRYKEAEKSLLQAEDAIKLMVESGKYDEEDIDNMSSALYGTFGNLYNTLGEGAKALAYYHKALKIFRKYGWRESETICYCSMAGLYFCMGNLSHANAYYMKGDSISEITKDPLVQTACKRGMARIAISQGEYDKAWRLMDEVWNYLSSHPEEEGSSRVESLLTMTDIAFAQEDYIHAEELIGKALALCDSLQYKSSALYRCQARLYAHKGEWERAEQYAHEALAEDMDAPDVTKNTYLLLSDIYAHLSQPDKARIYREKADSVQTAWSNYAYQASLAEQETMYEVEQKDSLISNLSSQRLYLLCVIAVAVILILVFCIIVLLVRQNHQRQKAQLVAKVALEAETRERSLLAKDLHDGLGGMLSLLKLKIQNKEQDEAIRLLDESVQEMRRVAHHIMPEELQKNGLVTSLQDFAISVPGAQFHYFGDKRRLANDIELVIYRCAYELVNNAMKHAAADHIDIQLMVDSQQVVLTVSDSGKGMGEGHAAKSGNGLMNIRSRIAEYDGNMDIISSPACGTEINVTIPLKDDIQD